MEQLFGAIPSVLSGLGPNEQAREALVFAAWSRCAGHELEKRTVAVEFFENRLVVMVEDETWRRHLMELSPQMLARINQTLSAGGDGNVRFIEFRVDAKAVNAARKTKRVNEPTQAAHPVSPSLTKAAGAIADVALRERFLDAAGLYLAQQREKVKK